MKGPVRFVAWSTVVLRHWGWDLRQDFLGPLRPGEMTRFGEPPHSPRPVCSHLGSAVLSSSGMLGIAWRFCEKPCSWAPPSELLNSGRAGQRICPIPSFLATLRQLTGSSLSEKYWAEWSTQLKHYRTKGPCEVKHWLWLSLDLSVGICIFFLSSRWYQCPWVH